MTGICECRQHLSVPRSLSQAPRRGRPAADTILIVKRKAGAVTLYARGRDIEEKETALQFEKRTCRWTILGTASEVYVSNERAAVLRALKSAGEQGLSVRELMAATETEDRNAMADPRSNPLYAKSGKIGKIWKIA
jgi:hypothetical protein